MMILRRLFSSNPKPPQPLSIITAKKWKSEDLNNSAYKRKQHWTVGENYRLLQASLTTDDWTLISRRVQTRNPTACKRRFRLLLQTDEFSDIVQSLISRRFVNSAAAAEPSKSGDTSSPSESDEIKSCENDPHLLKEQISELYAWASEITGEHRRMWTWEEDQRLKEAIAVFRPTSPLDQMDWPSISRHVCTRSSAQCKLRSSFLLKNAPDSFASPADVAGAQADQKPVEPKNDNKKVSKSNRWTLEEIKQLLDLACKHREVNPYSFIDWQEISRQLEHRSPRSCRNKFERLRHELKIP